MDKLAIAKKVITDNIQDADCGIFFTRNLVGDAMTTIYMDDELVIDICRYYMYFEVFGLNPDEQVALERFYEDLRNKVCDWM